MSPDLDSARHERYFRRCLTLFPAAYIREDDARAGLAYMALCGLELLRPGSSPDGTAWCRWLYTCWSSENKGFASIPNASNSSVQATYFSLACLFLLRDPLLELDVSGVVEFVAACYNGKGGFMSHRGGRMATCDSRQTFMALASLRLAERAARATGRAAAADAAARLCRAVGPAVATQTELCRTFDGGIAMNPGGEAHAGFTFCAIAALRLSEADLSLAMTRHWLWQRLQDTGACNGRTGKPVDTCYSFWVGASLHLLDGGGIPPRVGEKMACDLLSRAQCPLLGGFGKHDKSDAPDVLHSFLALAAMGLGLDGAARIPRGPERDEALEPGLGSILGSDAGATIQRDADPGPGRAGDPCAAVMPEPLAIPLASVCIPSSAFNKYPVFK